jgi:glyoxylase-like metal-dependent hydrolase (beta-lactamase superfamily II)
LAGGKEEPVPLAALRASAPDLDERGRVVFGQNAVLVQLAGANVLIDDGVPTWVWLDPLIPSPGVDVALANLGLTPESITHVVTTHAHSDHYVRAAVQTGDVWQTRYPRARYLLGRADWEDDPRRHDPTSGLAHHFGTAQSSGQLVLVDAEHEIVPGISVVHAPGESPGHCVVRVRSGGKAFYALGDLVHNVSEVEQLDWFLNGDPVTLRASRERIFAEANDATVVFTHRPFPGWGRIVRTASGYRWEDA